MKYIARGYATWDPADTEPLEVVRLNPKNPDAHDMLRRGVYWEFEQIPSLWDRLVARIPDHPTARSRMVGVGIVAFLLLVVLAVAGAVEGRADQPRPKESAVFAQEWATWTALGHEGQRAYCEMYRGYAEYVWLDGMSESAYWYAPPRMQERVAQRVLTKGCGVWQR